MRHRFDPPGRRYANRRRTGKEVRERRRGIMARLKSGPWPTRFAEGLLAYSGTHAKEIAERSLKFLEADGLIERFTDESNTENWRIKA
jgi:hypothetical protein